MVATYIEKTHLDLLELEISQLIYSQCFKCGMEERDGMEPLQEFGDGLAIDQ